MKLYSPKDLANENEHLTARWIREHAESLGFKRIGKGRGKWLASRESIERALGECSTNKKVRITGTLSSSIVGSLSVSPLEQRIKETLQELKAKRREERNSRL